MFQPEPAAPLPVHDSLFALPQKHNADQRPKKQKKKLSFLAAHRGFFLLRPIEILAPAIELTLRKPREGGGGKESFGDTTRLPTLPERHQAASQGKYTHWRQAEALSMGGKSEQLARIFH